MSIPPRINLGQHLATTMAHPMMQRETWIRDGRPNPFGNRIVMGYRLPTWQRGAVWSREQQISFIESAWRGVPLGTYTYVVNYKMPELDDLLIDGQQRLTAIENYISGEFSVFGLRFDELPQRELRRWEMSTMFACYRVDREEAADETYLRNYYNLMNFGGTAHRPEERA